MEQSVFETVDLGHAQDVERLVRAAFDDNSQRLKHILKVAECVRETAVTLKEEKGIPIEVDCAYRAALLHDIGYASELHRTGFHPVDGALYLQRRGYPELASYIACHSNSPELAAIRALPPIPLSDALIADLITYWDVRVAPGGAVVSYEERLRDIRERHSPTSDVSRAHALAEPRIQAIQQRIDDLLAQEAQP